MNPVPRPLRPLLDRTAILSLFAVLLLAGCAHGPTGPASSRPAPEPIIPVDQPPESWLPVEPAPEEGAQTAGDRKRALLISLGSQEFHYSEDGERVRTGPISSGAEGYPTPTGRFSVLSKDREKVSSRYTNQLGMPAWMPYAIPFNGHYFLHEGWIPGYPDSHGCVRVGDRTPDSSSSG